MYRIIALIFLACIFLGSCLQDTPAMLRQEPFFDLEGYIDAEVERLEKLSNFRKTTAINGKSESKMVDELNPQEDLTIFRNSDINRIAWLDKYRVDSTMDDQGLLHKLFYRAMDKDMRTQEMEITFFDNAVDQIRVLNQAVSTITSSKQYLLYSPATGYSIESHQEMVGSEARQMKVEVLFP